MGVCGCVGVLVDVFGWGGGEYVSFRLHLTSNSSFVHVYVLFLAYKKTKALL